MPNPDESLAGPEPTVQQAGQEPDPVDDDFAGGMFGNPNAPLLPPPAPIKYLSLDEVLSSARRKRTYAHICLRGDLEGKYEGLVVELGGMVDTQGRPTQQTEQDAALSDTDGLTLAQAKADEVEDVRRQMLAATRTVEFEGMPEDKWTPWEKQHRPKGEDPDLRPFHNKLIAEVSTNPKLSVDDMVQLRSVLGAKSINELENQAYLANVTGGVDIPKSPAFLRNLRQR